MSTNRFGLACALAAATALAGCAAKPEAVAIAVPDFVPPAPAPMPLPPQGATPGMMIPAALADGSYPTPNRGLSAAGTVWHLRAALNVAALGCSGGAQNAMIAQYNALLTSEKAPLAAAQKALIAEFRAGGAADGAAAYDAAMTTLYNFFAQPPAKAGFCAAAADVLSRSATVTPATMNAFAATALPQLDAPFTAFYRAYDGYRVQLANWRADRAPLPGAQPVVAMAIAAPVAVAEQPPVPATDTVAVAARVQPRPTIGYDPSVFRMP